MALTPKQAAFVREYLVDLNATKAAERAGYSVDTARSIGHENLTKPDIADAIERATKERAERTQITADYVLNGIKGLVERCIQAVSVLDDEGNETGEWRFEANPALKGYELLGKHLRLFTDKVEHSGKVGFVELIEQLHRERAEEQRGEG